MLFTIYVAALLTLIASASLLRSLSEHSLGGRSRAQHQAFALAETAVDASLRNLRAGQFGNLTTTNLAGGLYWAAVADAVQDPSLLALQRRISAHGQYQSEQRDVEALAQLTPVSVFGDALFGDEQVIVRGNATTDSYDSRVGAYGEPRVDAVGNTLLDERGDPILNQDDHGDVGTNATTTEPEPSGIDVSGSIGINGQVVVGSDATDPNSVVEINGGAVIITADPPVVSQATPMLMPEMSVPAGLTCSDQSVIEEVTLPSANGPYCFHNLQVTGGGILTTDGPVEVYITGRLAATGNTVVGVAAHPAWMLFLLTSTQDATVSEATVSGTTSFYGGLYAPSATITIRGDAEIFGSVVANTIDLAGNASVHYDEAMSEREGPIGSYETRVLFWRDLSRGEQ
jgi:hypothetical protein